MRGRVSERLAYPGPVSVAASSSRKVAPSARGTRTLPPLLSYAPLPARLRALYPMCDGNTKAPPWASENENKLRTNIRKPLWCSRKGNVSKPHAGSSIYLARQATAAGVGDASSLRGKVARDPCYVYDRGSSI